MSFAIPESDWTWCGGPHHFVGRSNCRFHLATQVGLILVSTVGEYRPPSSGGDMKPLGLAADSFYETMVFLVEDYPGQDCPIGQFTADGQVECVHSSTPTEASTAHRSMARRWSSLTVAQQVSEVRGEAPGSDAMRWRPEDGT